MTVSLHTMRRSTRELLMGNRAKPDYLGAQISLSKQRFPSVILLELVFKIFYVLAFFWENNCSL